MFRNGFFSYCLPPIKYIVYLLAFCAAQINWEINAAQESKRFFPLGVIGAIVSWNYPFHNVFNPMLAAVFSGNAAVIKVNIMI